MIPSTVDPENMGAQNNYMKFRANGLKSRNNYSLVENTNKEASLSTGAIAPIGGHS